MPSKNGRLQEVTKGINAPDSNKVPTTTFSYGKSSQRNQTRCGKTNEIAARYIFITAAFLE